ncbi:YrdB family protein [Frigoribacterium sp. 2-23]|uniref:YrdB family protein n=1 Tax=Frigoribacterium sp. 2-23 TaxID=3415006 RepID=UPI003C700CD6
MTHDVPPSSPADGRGPGGLGGRRITALDVVRFASEVFAFVSLGVWGYYAWPFPWPGVLFMIGAPLFAVVVWGLFRSPRAPIATDSVGKALVEIAVMGAVVVAWFMLGHPVVGGVFAVVALVTGVLVSRREARA